MTEDNCTHDCSSCGKNCTSRKAYADAAETLSLPEINAFIKSIA